MYCTVATALYTVLWTDVITLESSLALYIYYGISSLPLGKDNIERASLAGAGAEAGMEVTL